MKNFVEPIKLTEPVKPVKNQSLSVNQQKPQQQGEEASGKNEFQAMLDKQVQERRMQDKKLDANKQQNKAAEKTKESKQAKAEVATKKATEVVEDEAVDTPVVNAEFETAKQKPVAAKQHVAAQKVNVKGDTKQNSKAKVASDQVSKDLKADAKLSEQAEAKQVEVSQPHQPKGVKVANKSHRQQTEKTSNIKVDAEKTVDTEEVAVKDIAPKVTSVKQQSKNVDEQSAEHADMAAQTKMAQPHGTQANQAPVENTTTVANSEEQMPDHHILNQAPSADKLIKSAEKHLLNTADQKQVEVVATDESAEDMEMLVKPDLQDKAGTEHIPKHSAIAELQKTALEKRHQAKQLQKDMAAGQLRSAMVKESVGERSGLEGEVIPRSERAADFIQTMNIQAATTKPAAQRPVHAESFKADELKAAANKAAETPTPLASTQTTAGANAALQSSNVMTAAPMGSSNQIYAYPGKSGWNQAISQKVMYMVGASEQTARLSLNPPELGPLQVVIEVNDEKANTTFISDNEEVRQALEDGMDYLREKMDEAGISLGEANVNDGQRFNQSNQQEGFANTFKQSGGNQSTSKVVSEEAVVSEKVQSSNNGLVDTFA